MHTYLKTSNNHSHELCSECTCGLLVGDNTRVDYQDLIVKCRDLQPSALTFRDSELNKSPIQTAKLLGHNIMANNVPPGQYSTHSSKY
jgi:hypothetical protein